LRKYPFDINDIELDLSFYESYPKDAPKGYVTYVSYVRGRVCYSENNPEELGLSDLAEETFSEAVRKVKASRKGR
jgi:hypothetical protein